MTTPTPSVSDAMVEAAARVFNPTLAWDVDPKDRVQIEDLQLSIGKKVARTAIEAALSAQPAGEVVEEDRQSDIRMRFNEALAGGANMNGDAGHFIHTEGHACDLEEAIRVISELRSTSLPSGDERAKVVAFIRNWNGSTDDGKTSFIADAIERGDHLATAAQEASGDTEPAQDVAEKAEFHVAPYEDCGTARVVVRYDTTPPSDPRADCRDNIWLENGYGGDQWIAFDYKIADELCRAILNAASSVSTALKRNSGAGGGDA